MPADNQELDATLARLTAAVLNLREEAASERQTMLQELAKSRELVDERFLRFTSDWQQALQSLHDELTGEKRLRQAALRELIERLLDLERLAQADSNAGLQVALRSAGDALTRFGISRFSPASGACYRPDLHEAVGHEATNDMEPGRVVRVLEPGFVVGEPEQFLRRAKVIVSE